MSTSLLGAVDRYFIGVQLIVVGVVALLAGWAGASVAGSKLIPEGRTHARSTPSVCYGCDPDPDRSEHLRASGADVVQRDPFCSSCDKGSVAKPAPSPKATQRLDDAVLVATQVAPTDTDWTLASVRFPGAGQVRVLGQGSRVADAEITRVTATQVEFVRQGQPGVLDLMGGQAAPPKRPTPKSRTQGCPASVQKTGAGRFAIDRPLLTSLLQGLGGTTRDVAVAPLQQKGRLAGLQLRRVRARSVFHCLGLRAGDQITAVNNRRLTSPDIMLTLMAELPAAGHVTVSLTRQGRPRTLDYSIQ